MAYYPNAIVVAESSDESPGSNSPADTSPDDMQAFYDDVERREILERKLSKRKSNSGTSMWSRGSSKRPTVPAPAHATTSEFPRIPSKNDIREKDARNEAKPERERVKRNSSHQLTSSRSVTADRDNLTWTAKGAWPDVPLATIKIKYPLHNPMGPRWYRNHHLIPPSQKRPSMRPPTFFSPSFPPIHTSSSPGHIMDDTEDHDGTPAHSPQPTPTSSQTRVAEGGKRSRKTSQTTPDNVDLLDVTDPWGQSWHHRSPYDFDFGNTPDSHDVPNRTRRASMTATQNKHQSVTPSPLSQSTSAVHLPPPQPQIHIPRKLSKRRTPTADAVFKDQPIIVDHRKAASAPPTPIELLHVTSPADVQPSESNFLPKRMSVAPPPAHSAMYQTPKKEKRGSMLNRLAKKFSILRKSTDDHVAGKEYWHHADDQEIRGYNLNGQSSTFGRGPPSPEKSRPESVRRVPPPSEHVPDPAPAPIPVESKRDADRTSVSSLETPYSMGRLTVANPDLPDSEKETQDFEDVPVPRENPPHVEQPVDSNILDAESSYFPHFPQPSTIDARSRFDKPLPPPQLATPRFSELGLAVPETPEVVEQPLPPPPPSQKLSPNRNNTKSPPMQGPQEHTKAISAQSQAASSSSPNVPTQSNTNGIALPPAPTQVTHETPKRSSSQVKPPINKELPLSPETTPDRSRTQSPPMPQSFAQYEAPKKFTVQVQPSTLSRDLIMSPEPANLSRNLGHERAATQPSSSANREHLPEASSSKRRDSKQIRHQSRSEDSPALPLVPFPTTVEHALPVPVPEDPKSYNRYDASPLSTSSVLANPPTPYDYRQSIALTPDQSAPPSLPPKSIYEGKTSHNHNPSPIRTSVVNPSPSNPSPSRQTETFKLVRSSSGNVYASGQTITAQGQQWEVVESVESKGRKEKTSSRSKDQEYRSREHEHRAKEPELKAKDHERRSRDYEPRSRDADYRDHEQRSREHEYRSKEPDRKSTYRSKDSERARDNEKAKDYELPKDYVRLKDNERSRTQDYELPKDYERTKAHKDHNRSKDYERSKDQGRSREHEKPKEYEKSREYERSRDYEQSRDGHRREHERPRDPEQPRSSHRPKDADRSKDYTRSRDYEPRSKEDEQNSHRNSKKDSRPPPKTEVISNTDHHRSSNRLSKPAAPHPSESSKVRSNGKSSSRLEEPSSKSSRHRDEHRERKPEHLSTEVPFSSNHHATRPQPVPVQPPNPPLAPVRLERNPSLTARPTSELPSAAEMNAIRAKESWDMERLWKARSMYGLEPNAPTTNFIHGPGSSSSRSDDAHTQSAVYGSSHTAYVVQSPFQGSEHRSQIYHSMPTAPPPIIYSSPAYIPSIPDSISSYDPDEHVFRTYHTPQAAYQAPAMDYRTSPPSLPRPPLSNPLPEPPRESPFDATKSTVRSSKRQSNDYWMKYNGITTAH